MAMDWPDATLPPSQENFIEVGENRRSVPLASAFRRVVHTGHRLTGSTLQEANRLNATSAAGDTDLVVGSYPGSSFMRSGLTLSGETNAILEAPVVDVGLTCMQFLPNNEDYDCATSSKSVPLTDLRMELQLETTSLVAEPRLLLGNLNNCGLEEEASEAIARVDEGSASAQSNDIRDFVSSTLMTQNVEEGGEGMVTTYDKDVVSKHVPRETIGSLPSNFIKSNRDFLTGNAMNSSTASTASEAFHGLVDVATKFCKFTECAKSAVASKLCFVHGGNRQCQKQGCNKVVEEQKGGSQCCQSLDSTKGAEGKADYYMGHSGGYRCSQVDCTKAARGQSGLCIRHGGGKRCQQEGCTKSAEGYFGLCISHGGGRRCQYPGCGKSAQGSTMFCKAHGGGKRCMIQGCNKGAEGSTPLCKGHGGGKRCMFDGGGICTKSVHGGTLFCIAHGGGKRCAVPGCPRSARGRTEFCVRHGGGKRCKFEGCTKSAQGSTDFCKAHGGGTRCLWGKEGSPYFKLFEAKLGERPCEKFARGKIGLCAAHSALVQDRRMDNGKNLGQTFSTGISPGLFRGLALASTHIDGSSMQSVSADNLDQGHNSLAEQSFKQSETSSSIHLPFYLHHPFTNAAQTGVSGLSSIMFRPFIPPQVLVPLSMRKADCASETDESTSLPNMSIPDEKVHGGNALMSLLNIKDCQDDS